jgi:hypothetical protein
MRGVSSQQRGAILALAGVLAALALLVSPSYAMAYRAATEEESGELLAAIEETAKNTSPEAAVTSFTDARVSGSWASAIVVITGVSAWQGGSRVFYERSPTQWEVIAVGHECFTPSDLAMPAKVALDLGACKPPPVRHYRSRVRFQTYSNGLAINVFKRGSFDNCSRDRRTWAKITIKSEHRKLRFTNRNICTQDWRTQGAKGFKGLKISQGTVQPETKFTGTGIGIFADGHNINKRFRIVVRTRDRKATGILKFRVWTERHWPREEKIWEGSDAFVNYCINKGKEIRSSGGRLYCVRLVGNKVWWRTHYDVSFRRT